jgi:beta-lactamase superfamily II metal-dependent hydrolase
MQFHIFNVGHGSCAFLIADNGSTILFDCGRDNEGGFRPSLTLPRLGCTRIDEFVISHYDSDHVADLANLRVMSLRGFQAMRLACL